jgi:hypothetical protein
MNLLFLLLVGLPGDRVLRRIEPGGRDLSPGQAVSVSPDGRRVVYSWQQGAERHLYSARLDRVEPAVQLDTGPLVGLTVQQFRISPDSSLVVFERYEPMGLAALYQVPIEGGVPLLVDGPVVLEMGHGFDLEEFTPGSESIVYKANREPDGVGTFEELVVTSLAGGSPLTLAGPLGFPVTFQKARLTPDATRVVAFTDNGSIQLISVPLAGGSPVVLDGPVTVPALFEFSTDSTRVVYSASHVPLTPRELFSVPVDGSAAPARISAGAEVGTTDFALVPGQPRVVYLADEDTPGIHELYSVDLQGGDRVRLNPPLVTGGSVQEDFRLSADGQQVVFRADALADERFLLLRVPVTGGPAQVVNGPLAPGGDVTAFEVAPQGDWLVYRADQDVNEVFTLYRASLAGGTPVPLDTPNLSTAFVLGPDPGRILVHDRAPAGFGIVHLVPTDGSPRLTLNPAPGPRSNDVPIFVRGSSHVLFVGGATTTAGDLFLSAPLPGRASPASPPALPGVLWTAPGG